MLLVEDSCYMPYDKTAIIAMTEEYAREISKWKYDGIYSFYDHSEANVIG